MIQKILLSILSLLILTPACTGVAPSPTPTSSRPWTEEQVTFNFDRDELFGILTLPTSEGPYPAIVIVSGSVSVSTGYQDGVNSPYFKDFACNPWYSMVSLFSVMIPPELASQRALLVFSPWNAEPLRLSQLSNTANRAQISNQAR